MKRISWQEYFSEIVLVTSKRSPCNRLKVGCLLVKDNRILSQGYNGFLKETTSGRQDGISCALCEQPKRNGAYCASHKRAYDTIYRAAMQPDARKQPAEDAVWDAVLLTWKKTSHWFVLIIFGDDKQRKSGKYAQPQLVARLLCQFVIDHPEGKEKRKVRRHAVNLYSFFSVFGARQSSDEVTGLKKVDEEIFTGMMKMYRSWNDARALEVWNEHKADPDVPRDELGPRHSKLRLHLPYSLFGEDRQEDKKQISHIYTINRLALHQRMMILWLLTTL